MELPPVQILYQRDTEDPAPALRLIPLPRSYTLEERSNALTGLLNPFGLGVAGTDGQGALSAMPRVLAHRMQQ